MNGRKSFQSRLGYGLFAEALENRALHGGSLKQYLSPDRLDKPAAMLIEDVKKANVETILPCIRELQSLATLGSAVAHDFFADRFIERFAARNFDLRVDEAAEVWCAYNEVGSHSHDTAFLAEIFEKNSGLTERQKICASDVVVSDAQAAFTALDRLANHPVDKTAAAKAAMKFAQLYAAELEPVASALQSISRSYEFEMLRHGLSAAAVKDHNAYLAHRNWVIYSELGVYNAKRDLLCSDAAFEALPDEEREAGLAQAQVECRELVCQRCYHYFSLSIGNMIEAGAEKFRLNQVLYINFIRSPWISDDDRVVILQALTERFAGHEVVESLNAMLRPAQESELKKLRVSF